jgi:hypothetical protein
MGFGSSLVLSRVPSGPAGHAFRVLLDIVRTNSLFCRFNSLFERLGNSPAKGLILLDQ